MFTDISAGLQKWMVMFKPYTQSLKIRVSTSSETDCEMITHTHADARHNKFLNQAAKTKAKP